MASVVRKKAKTGIRYDIQLSPNEHPDRPKIALGQVTKADALNIKIHIEKLIRQKMGAALPTSTLEWLNGSEEKPPIPEALRDRLEKLELVERRNNRKSYFVSEWCEKYIKMREQDKQTKGDTIRKLENVSRRLSVFFKNTPLSEVNVLQAKNFRAFLTGTESLSENTCRKHIAISRQFFNAAIDGRIISENPFRGQPVSVQPNKSRFFYVHIQPAMKILAACPDVEWRLIFGLARFGALRCPSEVLRLKWTDVDFENEEFTVHSSKTEHHANKEKRVVPMFPELKPLFQDAFDQAELGAVYCITRYRGKTVNLRTQLNRIVKRAGLTPWPKPFQNLRSTRETELFKLTGGNIKAVCEWVGNTPAVAMQHYAQITEADMKEAAKMTILNNAQNKVQDWVQTPDALPEINRKDSQDEKEGGDVSPSNFSTFQQKEQFCKSFQNADFSYPMGDTGFEPVTSRV